MLDHLTPAHRQLFAQFSLGTQQHAPFHCVHQAFEFHAAAQPLAIAVEHLGDTITYAELDRIANHLATQLRTLGVETKSRVCLLVERSIIMVVGIMAILKAGGAYVPLDGGIITQSTLEHVLLDSECSVVLTLQKYFHRVSDIPGCRAIILENAVSLDSANHCAKPEDWSSPNDGAYVIYTSGTTGQPKGVDVKHSNVTNLLCLSPGNLGMRPGLRVSQLMNIAFDMAAWEILGSLCNGSTLCIRGKSSKEWREVLKKVDIVIATPSMMVPHNPADYPNIKVVATAGEVCPQALADSWAARGQFINSCGPTEITIVNTAQLHTAGTPLTIGKPTPNNNVYILDEDLKPLPIGQTGIMWAGGAGITRGYINLPEKTSERYKSDPFMNDGSMIFNTGDLGRWRPDGQLEHLGRVDDQVKVKGFRVELDGVAAAMETCAGVKTAVVLLIDNELWGFFTPATVSDEEVRRATAKSQPYYAVPTHFVALNTFPHTANGKTDKRELRRVALGETNFSEMEKMETVLGYLSPPPPVYQKENKDMQLVNQGPPTLHASTSFSPSTSDTESTVPSSAEKGYAWAGYENDDIPDKTQGKALRNLRHQIFTLYRRLFSVVFVTNMAIFISILVKGEASTELLGKIVVANVFCAVLMRQDYVINAFFIVFCSVPASWPLCIRRVCARVYHIGGLHSGSGVSATVWLILFTVQATREMVAGRRTSMATVIVTYWILLLLLGIVMFAHPKVRTVAHDNFERTHRFLGWAAVALVWCQVVLLTNDHKSLGASLGHTLVTSPSFWMVIVLTISIALPWMRLRKVPVRAEILSKHAVRLHFNYVTPIAGSFTRISDNPLMEWHGFATIPEPGKPGYSLVVSRAGDWTAKQISEPPTELWVRGVPTFGVLRIVPLFRRVVFVATGSGIGPCAPCILEQRVPIRLLWTSPNVRETFGDKLVDSILDAAPGAVIYDTRVHGKPDMVKLTYRLVKEFNAEAVCIISNVKLTRKVVYGMMSRGIPAFGAIWDS